MIRRWRISSCTRCEPVVKPPATCWCARTAGQRIQAASSGRFARSVKRTAGRGRACLEVWPGLHIGTVIKHTVNKRLTEVVRQMSYGALEPALVLLKRSEGGAMLNTSSIERFNATMRERLATLTRKCRYAAHRLQTLQTGMYLIGSTSNFCCFHQQLSKPPSQGAHAPQQQTEALASGLTDHCWSLSEL